MAARYTEVTLEDMERFLKRAYRVLRPKKGEQRGEVYYDLNLSDGKIFVRVWTSIRPRSGTGAGVGEDAIRVTMITRNGKPLMPKGKIVKRTQNWRNNLQSRIEELIETYESKTGYWKDRQSQRDQDEKTEPKPSEVIPEPKTTYGEVHEGQFARLSGGDWGARIFGKANAGDAAVLSSKGGRKLKVTLIKKVWSGRDRFSGQYAELWSWEKGAPGKYATDVNGDSFDLQALLVAERYYSNPRLN